MMDEDSKAAWVKALAAADARDPQRLAEKLHLEISTAFQPVFVRLNDMNDIALNMGSNCRIEYSLVHNGSDATRMDCGITATRPLERDRPNKLVMKLLFRADKVFIHDPNLSSILQASDVTPDQSDRLATAIQQRICDFMLGRDHS